MDTFRKRQKEMQRLEKAREKAEKRAARKLTRGTLSSEFVPDPEDAPAEETHESGETAAPATSAPTHE